MSASNSQQTSYLVDLIGIEPMTSSMPSVDEAPVRRAIAAYAPDLTDNGLEQG
jgi:hypothetical protein